MNRKLILVSADAMSAEDLPFFLTLPNARRLFADAARAARLRSVLPTLTYPCHATMLTGCGPARHGIAANTMPAPGDPNPPWRWERGCNLEPDDLLYAAKRRGLTAASVFWPTTGRHPAADWLIPEYWPQGPGDTLEQAMGRMGASPEVLRIIEANRGDGRIDRHPQADFFAVRCACDILRRYRPDVLLLHPANIDEAKHRHGTAAPEVKKALEETDEFIGLLLAALEETGLAERTNFVLTSDHGQRDVRRLLRPNALLRREGLIRVEGGGVRDWQAWCRAEGMFAAVYLRRREDPAVRERVRSLLRALAADPAHGVARVYTREEAEAAGLPGSLDFALTGDGRTAFSSDPAGPLTDAPLQRATHGYPPDMGPDPVFLAAGPDFRRGGIAEEMDLTDVAPTCAALLGARLPRAEGRARGELLARGI